MPGSIESKIEAFKRLTDTQQKTFRTIVGVAPRIAQHAVIFKPSATAANTENNLYEEKAEAPEGEKHFSQSNS